MKNKSLYILLLSIIILPGYRYLIQGLNEIYFAAAVFCFCTWSGMGLPYSLVMIGGGYRKIKLPRHPWVYLTIVGAWILSVIFSTWPQGSLAELVLWGICIILFVVVINLPADDRDHILFGLLVTGLIYNAAKLYQVGELLLGLGSGLDGRLPWPNPAAAFVNLIIIISISTLLNRSSKSQRPWAWIGLSSSLIILWFTGSRGGALAGMIGIAVILFVSWLNDPAIYKRPGLVAMGHLVGSGLFFYTSSIYRVAAVVTDAASTFEYRLEVWQLGLDLFNKYPLLGAGPNTFYYQALAINPDSNPIRWIHPHSLYIQILAELGVIGIIAVSVLLLVVLYSLLIDSIDPKYKAVGLAVVAVTLVHGLVDMPWHEPFVMRAMIVLMALALAPPEPNHQNDK